ncbi:MAG TPA: arginine--tRNA ligase, partial [Limnochordia bacterium]|nr:arginine--tRNA ligase [Limnochordia bacterium]
MSFREHVVQSLADALGALGVTMTPKQVDEVVEVPPDPKLGAYAFPCFTLARTLRKAPPVIAADLVERLKGQPGFDEWCDAVEAVGAYVNFQLRPDALARAVLGAVLSAGERYGAGTLGQGKRVVIDYSSPNMAKPLGVHHIRSTGIGNSLHRIYRFLGYEVVAINFLGDWGKTFGELVVAYRKWGDPAALEAEPIKELLRVYVKFNQEVAADPALDDQGRAAFKALEDGDPEVTTLWERFRELSISAFERIYERMGVHFDVYSGESVYAHADEAVLAALAAKGLVAESEGATVVELEGMPPCLLKKSDGATLYALRDLAAAMDRWEQYRFDKSLYVVDVAQSLHFKQLFGVLGRLEAPWADRLEHVSFGRYSFADGSMSTRRGRIVFLEDVFDEAVRRVRAVIAERNPELPDAERVAEQVGVGAVLFFDLKHSRVRDITFSWEEAVNLEGDTGPYLQYTHARIASLLRRGGWDPGAAILAQAAADLEALDAPEAIALIKHLDDFGRVVERAGAENEP